jgi:hypothetical protein
MSTTPKIPYCFVENDLLPEPVFVLLDTDLTDYTVTLHLKRGDDSVLIKAATPMDLTQGQFRFVWGLGDLQAGVNQQGEIQFVSLSGDPLTSRLFLMDVREELA